VSAQVTIMGPPRDEQAPAVEPPALSPEAIAFARWLAGDNTCAPPGPLLRAEFIALHAMREALETAMRTLARELHQGYERALVDHDMPSAGHEFAAGYKAGASGVAAHAAGRLVWALQAAESAARSAR
jgi:hypothetical protein